MIVCLKTFSFQVSENPLLHSFIERLHSSIGILFIYLLFRPVTQY